VDLPGEEAQTLAATARAAGYENLLRLMHQLLTSEPVVRRSETGVLAVEIAWLRAAELPKLTRIEELLAGAVPLPEGRPAAAPAPRLAAATPSRPPVPAAPPPQRAEKPAAAAPAPAPRPAPEPAAPPPAPAARPPLPADPIQAFLEQVSLRRQPFAALLAEAELAFVDGELRIGVPPGEGMLESRLQQPSVRKVIDESVAAVWGAGTAWRQVRAESRTKNDEEAPVAAPAQELSRVAEIPKVQAILDIFGGKVETVEEHGFREEPTR
jgi:hypothetical protein